MSRRSTRLRKRRWRSCVCCCWRCDQLNSRRATLPQLLAQLTIAMRSRSSTVIELVAEPLPLLAPDVQIAVYRIAQEALNNVVKHGKAHTGRVSLHGDATGLRLTVADDGVGFDPDAVPGGHLGVRGMYERAAAVGAASDCPQRPGCGNGPRVGLACTLWRSDRAALKPAPIENMHWRKRAYGNLRRREGAADDT